MKTKILTLFILFLTWELTGAQSVGIPYTRVGLRIKLPVQFSSASGVGGSWIGLYREADGDGAYLSFQYIHEQVNGELSFAGIETEGIYNFRMFQGNGYNKIATSAPFLVVRGMVIDSSFGSLGSFHWDASGGGLSNGAAAARTTTDGKIFIAGSVKNGKRSTNGEEVVDFTLVKLDLNGMPDQNFGSQGRVTITPKSSFFPVFAIACKAMAIQRDGKILVGGDAVVNFPDNSLGYTIAMVRIHPDGSLDESFADKGTLIYHFTYDGEIGKVQVNDELKCIEVMPDQKIIVGGGSILSAPFAPGRPFIGRFLPNGMYDGSFGTVGIITPLDSFSWRAYVESIVPDPASSGGFHAIATARAQFGFNHQILYKFDDRGQYDTQFGNGRPVVERKPGIHNETYSRKLIHTDDGELLYGGGSDVFFLWMAKRSAGSGVANTSFGKEGLAVCDPAELEVPGGMIADRNRIYLAYTGNGRQLGMARYDVKGNSDVVFGFPYFEFKDHTGTYIEYRITDLIRQDKDRYVAVGWSRHFNPPHYETFAFAFKDNPAVFTGLEDEKEEPMAELYQNYPNPFDGWTHIPFRISAAAEVSLEIYDLQGVRLASMDQGTLEKGYHEIMLNRNSGLIHAAQGNYLFSLVVRQGTKTFRQSKVFLVK